MSKTDTELTDREWEAKSAGPRKALLKRIFGDTPCKVADISPKTVVKDENWEEGKSFMEIDNHRVYKQLDTTGLAELNRQLQKDGRVVLKMRAEQLKDLRAKAEPVK